jgi:hypothetical protein
VSRKAPARERFSSIDASSGARLPLTCRVERREGKLVAQFADGKSPLPQVLDLSRWLPMGSLVIPFSEAFAVAYGPGERSSRKTAVTNITYGLIAFLSFRGKTIDDPADLTSELLREALAWLRRSDSAGISVLKPMTQTKYWGAIKKIVKALQRRDSQAYSGIEFPTKPFAGVKFASEPPRELDIDDYVRFITRVCADVAGTIDEIRPRLKKLNDELARLDKGRAPRLTSIEGVAAFLMFTNEGVVPERKQLLQGDLDLFRAVSKLGYTEIRRIAHPQINDLIPFVYVMASHTGYNEQPLTHLDQTNVSPSSMLGTPKRLLTPPKLRAGEVVRRSFVECDEKLSVPNLIDFLEEWTAHIRSVAPRHVEKDLWLFVNKWKAGKCETELIKSLAFREKKSLTVLSGAMRTYCRSIGWRWRGMKEMRLTFSELFLRASPGNLEGLRVLLGQKSINTTANHYRTQQGIRQSEEMLSGATQLHQRWIGSRGKIDSRFKNENRPRTATQEGFDCMDPLDSPIPGEVKGRLCEAYGQCPGCPLAMSNPDGGYALAWFLRWEEEYKRAIGRLGVYVWKRKFAGAYERLTTYWIPVLANPETLALARTQKLGPLAELE